MPVSVLTQHNDNARTGANLTEAILNTSNVNVDEFGKLFSHAVQGQIYAQPLYLPFVNVPGKGVHNVVIVATMENWVYAFDADDNSGANAQFLWARQIHPNPVPTQVFRPSYNDVVGDIGILSTPVIDATIAEARVATAQRRSLHGVRLARGLRPLPWLGVCLRRGDLPAERRLLRGAQRREGRYLAGRRGTGLRRHGKDIYRHRQRRFQD